MSLLSREQFIAYIASELEVDEEALGALSFQDAGLDSIQVFEIDLIVEELGVLLPEQAIVGAVGLADIYTAYVAEAAIQGSGHPPEPPRV